MDRRAFLGALAAAGLAPAAQGHTIYNQWVVYRRKHLHIGCHRKDPRTFDLAKSVVAEINHALPEAAARAARAPFPGRLASLLATDQLEIAVLSWSHAAAIRAGEGEFAPYGPVPLSLLAPLDARHVLVVHQAFPVHHGWLVAAALSEVGMAEPPENAPDWHAGVAAYRRGDPMPPPGAN